MGLLIHELKKHIKIYFLFVKNCLIAQMEYRANFIMSALVECAFLFAKMLYVIVVFKAGLSINGLSPDAILMFIGSYTIITGIMNAVFFPNVSRIPEYIRTGELDIYATKPVSLQFMVSFRYIDFGLAVPNVLAGIIMVAVSWGRLGIGISLINIAGYMLFTLIGIAVTYPVLMLPSLLSFWIVKTQALYDITWALWDFNNMPMGIYGKWLQRFGTFILPIFLITNFAPMFVMGLLSTWQIVWAAAAPVIFILILRLLWNYSVRNYNSSSS